MFKNSAYLTFCTPKQSIYLSLGYLGIIILVLLAIAKRDQPLAFIYVILATVCTLEIVRRQVCLAFPQSYYTFMLKIFPKQTKYYTYRGHGYFQHKQYELAIQDYNRASSLGSKMVDTYAYRGQIYLNRKEYQLAIQDFDHAILLNPRYAMAYHNRGYAYFSLREPQKAIQDFDQAIACARWPSNAIRKFDFDQALVAQRNLPQAYLFKGITYVILKEHAQAIQSLNKAISLCTTKKQQAHMYRGRALIYLQMREFRKALSDLHLALANLPPDISTYLNCGRAHFSLQEYLLATQACSQAIELDPKTASAYAMRGASFLGLSNLQQARADFEHAWIIDPQNISYNLLREWARLCSDQETPDEQIADHLIELAEANPKRPDIIHFCRGFAHWTRGKYEEALTEFEPALQLDPDPTQWGTLFWKGMTCASLGRNEEARTAIQTALAQAMPPILLSPLRWLEKERPEFYREFALPLLMS